MTSRSLGHRAPLLWLVLPYALGLAAGDLAGKFAPAGLLAAAGAGAGLAWFAAHRRPGLWAAALIAAAFLTGVANYSLHRARLPVWQELPPREADLVLQVDRVCAGKHAQRATGLATVSGTDPHLRELRGQ
ncbi:MAG: hypothetical protein RLZZ129_1621, partial [Verrucomicrobiota bacterium]